MLKDGLLYHITVNIQEYLLLGFQYADGIALDISRLGMQTFDYAGEGFTNDGYYVEDGYYKEEQNYDTAGAQADFYKNAS